MTRSPRSCWRPDRRVCLIRRRPGYCWLPHLGRSAGLLDEEGIMSKLPLASIVMSSYNYGRFLPDAIDSALGQTHANTEVIVVDDGSTDHSREVIAGYGERVRPVWKDNGGAASAPDAGERGGPGGGVFFFCLEYPVAPAAVQKGVSVF